MSEHIEVKEVIVNAKWGSSIQSIARECILLAVNENRTVTFGFNGVTVKVDPESIVNFVVRDYYAYREST